MCTCAGRVAVDNYAGRGGAGAPGAPDPETFNVLKKVLPFSSLVGRQCSSMRCAISASACLAPGTRAALRHDHALVHSLVHDSSSPPPLSPTLRPHRALAARSTLRLLPPPFCRDAPSSGVHRLKARRVVERAPWHPRCMTNALPVVLRRDRCLPRTRLRAALLGAQGEVRVPQPTASEPRRF